ncbi:hypothetical protein EV127DRAFT_224506 [Xylaria flabelliformis]|nr:hypothetical protein EV127DRAFT_224506 [Xylaria flabelliformis]
MQFAQILSWLFESLSLFFLLWHIRDMRLALWLLETASMMFLRLSGRYVSTRGRMKILGLGRVLRDATATKIPMRSVSVCITCLVRLTLPFSLGDLHDYIHLQNEIMQLCQ